MISVATLFIAILSLKYLRNVNDNQTYTKRFSNNSSRMSNVIAKKIKKDISKHQSKKVESLFSNEKYIPVYCRIYYQVIPTIILIELSHNDFA